MKLTILDNVGALILGTIKVIPTRNIKGGNVYSSYLLTKRVNNKVLNEPNKDKGVK